MNNFLNYIKLTRENYLLPDGKMVLGSEPNIVPTWVDKSKIVYYSPEGEGTLLFLEGGYDLYVTEDIDTFQSILVGSYE